MGCCGVVLAAGAGTRFGGPKARARDADGTPWLARTVQTLREAGCDPVLVTLGAAPDAAGLLPAGVVVVPVPGWEEGLSASLRAALSAAAGTDADAAVVVPVDMPALPASAVQRLVARTAPDALARATYGGEPGHPALIGRAHWAAVAASVAGDRGAAPYLAAHAAAPVPCDDLWSGADVDRR
ncbi:NTP transferase domain-containing protein [Microbacterium sp. W1N]|uniref:nucleotidyltransferase family protein n=1 Tax=Microbacterium festucae TaxID=2977531 RepID=UPI0021C1F5B3|nr:NTP transferase domain-containing protein [Microbacterium festucae]MCT9819357.1 NTP transferase domain-containing protein [Microbacterium festucae]